MDKLKIIIDWIIANGETIKNYAVALCAVLISVFGVILSTRKTLKAMKNDEVKTDNDATLKVIQAQMLREQEEMYQKYNTLLSNKMETVTTLLLSQQELKEQERQAEIKAKTEEVGKKLKVLKKAKGENENEKSTV